ncbi:MAG: class I SAM-dependent methyltransferase [Cytophagaceae bacterium]|nr:class I SAM-dependent methyltransferase [Cytophagaceae bacterium]
MINAFLRYLFRAGNAHGLHSPFVFELYTNVIRAKGTEPEFADIESLRKRLLGDRRKIRIQDFGAGSKINNNRERELRDIARNSEKPRRLARLMFRLVRCFSPTTIFDLGTSLGLTTLYFAKAAPNARILTFEGCPETAQVARQHFQELRCSNVETVVGNLDETLPPAVAAIDRIDFAFFDANHRYEPTVRYFETCLTKAHDDTLFIFDDIHWSPEMEKAWKYIQAHPKVKLTVDLFFIGLVFFRKAQPKQHFILRG